MDNIIDLTDDVSDDLEICSKGSNGRKHSICSEVKVEDVSSKKPKLDKQIPYDGEVEIIDSTKRSATFTSVSGNYDDADVQMVGVVNEVKLPHMRQHCTKHKFVPNSTISNSKFCNLCYCFVCDVPAKECKHWYEDESSSESSPWHCNANDKDRQWVQRRSQKKNLSSPQACDYDSDDGSLSSGLFERMIGSGRNNFHGGYSSCEENDYSSFFGYGSHRNLNRLPGDGPWKPDHADASKDGTLTKCRKCGWHSRLHNQSDFFCNDWCRKCGRVCDDKIFGRTAKSNERISKKDDVFFGEKIVPFRIVARNLRSMEAFRDSWAAADESDEAWKYDQRDMEEEMFEQRFGERPTVSAVLRSTSIVEEKDLPGDGSLSDISSNRNSADEVEAAVLEDGKYVLLFRCLHGLEVACEGQIKSFITARWDKQARSGSLKIRAFVAKRAFDSNHHRITKLTNLFLGIWCTGVAPFPLLDLTRHHEAIDVATSLKSTHHISIPPFSKKMKRKEMKELQSKITATIKKHNDVATDISKKLTLTSSCGVNSIGGFANNDISLKGALLRFYQEMPGSISDWNEKNRWMLGELNLASEHREMSTTHGITHMSPLSHYAVEALVEKNDYALASNIFKHSSEVIDRHCGSINGMLDHLENLGHESATHVEGLNINLLEYQKQTLKWAIEREMVPGGIQSYFWPKIPSPKTDLYYNPITGRFRKDKPRTVRGGFIAEEMGLGKTIISLSLILQNTAPELPKSCSHASSLSLVAASSEKMESVVAATSAEQEEMIGWDKDLYGKTSEQFPERGSIISRGTLVICPVSLVGQWIQEAKSKLTNPGLIYAYHGSKRNRDPLVLASNAIVVTTYQILVSDDNYYRKKSAAEYCPPLEQIRWWRIICDEGHFLRSSATQRHKTIANLAADNRWLVSGTPVNTSINDLKSQLKLLGIEHVDEMFGRFIAKAGHRSHNRNKKKETYKPELFFFLRSILMRHSMKQTYRGTNNSILELPPKTEIIAEIILSDKERKEYDVLDQQAKSFYLVFKEKVGSELSHHYLLLSQKLTPLRVACSGGSHPLPEEEEKRNGEHKNDINAENLDEDHDEKAKVTTKHSDFVFTSKFKVLVSKLEKIRDDDPSSKSLIFSQFTSTLNYLKNELPKHGFQYRTLLGSMTMSQRSKALRDFQNDPPTTVFLLSMRSGACGINLTQANRVFLMEPSFNPALEKQAIGRVHRLGQKRKVEIIRLIVKGSVETRIIKLLEIKYGAGSADESESEANDMGIQEMDLIRPVGNVASDRVQIISDEFDVLFGDDGIDKAKVKTSKRDD